jgi:hypothetical protein
MTHLGQYGAGTAELASEIDGAGHVNPNMACTVYWRQISDTEAPALDPLPDERDVTAELLAGTGMEPASGSPVLLHIAVTERAPLARAGGRSPVLGPLFRCGDVDAAPLDGLDQLLAAQPAIASYPWLCIE